MSSNRDSVTNNSSEHWTGRVKWFNNKAGYGFITITDGSRSGTDIFVHHSVINVENQQYKYLVQGEYVEFDMVRIESSQHEWQASNVSGIRGGKLMCETRRELKIARNEYRSTKGDQSDSNNVHTPVTPQPHQREQTRQTTPRQTTPRQQTNPPKARGEGPRESNDSEWIRAGRKNRKNTSDRSTTNQTKQA
jgi:cold shock CspA family protein